MPEWLAGALAWALTGDQYALFAAKHSRLQTKTGESVTRQKLHTISSGRGGMAHGDSLYIYASFRDRRE